MKIEYILEWRNLPLNHNPSQFIKTETPETTLEIIGREQPKASVKIRPEIRRNLSVGNFGCVVLAVYVETEKERQYHYCRDKGHMSDHFRKILPDTLVHSLVK